MQDYIIYPVRTAAILTNAYVAGNKLGPKTEGNPQGKNQMVLLIAFTIGSLTDLQIKVEFSHDDTTYYQETFSSVSTTTSTESLGIHKFALSGNYRIAIPIKDNYVKISAIGTGTVTSSSLTIDAVLGTV